MKRITATIENSSGMIIATGTIPAEWLEKTAAGSVTVIRCDPPGDRARGFDFLSIRLDPPS